MRILIGDISHKATLIEEGIGSMSENIGSWNKSADSIPKQNNTAFQRLSNEKWICNNRYHI